MRSWEVTKAAIEVMESGEVTETKVKSAANEARVAALAKAATEACTVVVSRRTL